MMDVYTTQYDLRHEKDLDHLTAPLAKQLQPGDVIALSGPMGSGKTTFVKYLGTHLGITERITSPTFVLIHEYLSGRIPLVHADFYRLGENGAETLAQELLEVIQQKSAVFAIEWAEWGPFLDPFITLRLTFAPPLPALDQTANEVGKEAYRQVTVQSTREELLTELETFEKPDQHEAEHHGL